MFCLITKLEGAMSTFCIRNQKFLYSKLKGLWTHVETKRKRKVFIPNTKYGLVAILIFLLGRTSLELN